MQSPKQPQATLELPADVIGFDSRSGPRLIYGLNVVDEVGAYARELSTNGRVLLVTDPGVEEAGHPERVERSLKASFKSVESRTLESRLQPNTTARRVTNRDRRSTGDIVLRRTKTGASLLTGSLPASCRSERRLH